MGMELQGLLDRINTDGLQKAEARKAEIIKAAEAQAASIIAEAKQKAAEMIKDAQSESDKLEERAKSAVRQAARDIVIGLRSELEKRLAQLTQSAVGESMTPDAMGKLVTAIVNGTSGVSGDKALELAVSKNIPQSDVDKLIASVTASLKTQPVIQLRSDFNAGLKIGVKGNDLFIDLSDEALTELICGYVGPKVAEILKPATATTE